MNISNKSQNKIINNFGCQHDRHKERELFEKSTEEKLEIIEKFKILGNE